MGYLGLIAGRSFGTLERAFSEQCGQRSLLKWVEDG